ncbi:MAG: hypothetical protein IMF14_06790, partial [Proteobacteria bacterium]|nr:hypothetical protein [Pseudomonadota bacterium]
MAEQDQQKLPSLRRRYLTLASLATAALLAGTSIASWYIHKAASNSAAAIAINETVTTTVFDLRNVMTSIDMTVNRMLIDPQASDETSLNRDLQQAQRLSTSLISYSSINSTVLRQPVTYLDKLINDLNEKVHYLITQRKDQEWVYPVMPLINADLLDQHRNFISAVE